MLCSTLGGAVQSWKTNRETTVRGKLQDRFCNVMQGFHGYRDLLSVVPNNDKYVCLLTGSLTALAQASMTHANVAEGITTAFEEAQLDLDYWKRLLAANPDNVVMQNYVIELFVMVFEMFVSIFTEWSGKGSLGRFFKSFNRDTLHNIVTKKQEQMQNLQQRLRDENGLSNTIVMQYVKNKIDTLDQTLEQRVEAGVAMAIGRLGAEYQLLLREEARRLVTNHISSVSPEPVNLLLQAADPKDSPAQINNERNAESVALLRAFSEYQAELLLQYGEMAQSAGVDLTLFHRLEEWIQSIDMRHLHVEGPALVSSPSRSTLSAATLVGICQRSDVPVLYFFCDDDDDDDPDLLVYSKRHRRTLLAQLVFCLLAQLASHLPADTSFELNESMSLSEAIQELERLLRLGPPILFSIIDGIQLLEDPEDAEQTQLLKQLATTLTQEHELKDGRVIKTCFTTDGFVNVLSALARQGRLEVVEYFLGPGESNDAKEVVYEGLD